MTTITHWTRATHGPWPTESSREYYDAIARSDFYPRSAFHTLQRIISDGRLVASQRHMPKDVAAVSFTSLPPEQMIPLMRWRARYRQMSFEPYGVGIRRERAEQLGIEPVIYVDDIDSIDNAGERWKHQSIGKHSDWRTEREYRHRGDLRHSNLPSKDLVIFCKTKEESARLSSVCDYRIISMFRD